MQSKMIAAMQVINPGPLAMLQDSGRSAGESLGIGQSGAIDKYSFSWANRLCGNNPGCAAIEITAGLFEARMLRDSVFALTGAQTRLFIDDSEAECWRSCRVSRGQVISVSAPSSGLRNYLAIDSGFQAKKVMGSVACNRREGIGGHKGDGSALSQGALVCAQQVRSTMPSLMQTPVSAQISFHECIEVRIVPGYQHERFSRDSIRTLLFNDFEISQQSDRMGIRLNGPGIRPPTEAMYSEGICNGAVQVPADGQPIIMLADRQTIGGYAKLGSVLSIDCDALAQAVPGTKVRFSLIDILDAQAQLQLAKYRVAHTMPLLVA